MNKKPVFTIEEIAKYNAITVFGLLQELGSVRVSVKDLFIYYGAMLMDLETGAMERSCKEFDRQTREVTLANRN